MAAILVIFTKGDRRNYSQIEVKCSVLNANQITFIKMARRKKNKTTSVLTVRDNFWTVIKYKGVIPIN